MKYKLFTAAIFLMIAAFGVGAQETPAPAKTTTGTKSDSAQTTSADASIYVRPDADARRKDYLRSIFGPAALARTVVVAGIGTARNTPEEWEGNWKGFGRRVASNFGRSVIRQTTVYALDESLKLDSKFYRSRKRDFGSRLKNAALSPVTARRADGKRVVGVPRIAGTYAANIIAAETWYPKRFDYKDGLRGGTISLGANVLFNVVREFIFKK